MLKVFKHRIKKNNYILVDVIRGKVVKDRLGYVHSLSKYPFDSVRADIFENDYIIDNVNSNKSFIEKLKEEIRFIERKYNEKKKERYARN